MTFSRLRQYICSELRHICLDLSLGYNTPMDDREKTKHTQPCEKEDAHEHQTANNIARGTERLLADMGLTSIREFSLTSGRRVDIAALAKDGQITFIEVKSSLADFRSDQKWPDYLEYCDRFFFAVARDFAREVLPAEHGLIVADRYGAEILRPDASEKTIVAARRKAVTLRFARVAATRLTTLLKDAEEDV